jgi:cytochrome c biogenesis protein CcdA
VIGEPVRLAEERRWRLVVRALVFAVGAIASSAAFGALLGKAGAVVAEVPHASLVIAVIAVAAVLGREVLALPIPIPQRRWQVPREWLRHFWLGSFLFGAIMGLGFLTYTSSMIYYLYLTASLLLGSALYGSLIGAAYGATFSLAVFMSTAIWLRLAPAEQTAKALARGRRAAAFGAITSPLLVLLPVDWTSASAALW